MRPCDCKERHPPRRVVVTGGPGAGKTAILELVRQHFCAHVDVLPEAAGILFAGGFRRGATVLGREAAQRAIFRVQRELEAIADAEGNPALVLCDRGTVDGFAYWPDANDFWEAFDTTRAKEHRRYDAVLHLRTPTWVGGYHRNHVRIESAEEAAAIDERICAAWAGHPRLWVIENTPDFLGKASRALGLLREQLPACCRHNGHPAA
jgi:predicted ATPase